MCSRNLTKLDTANQSSTDRPTTLKRQIETTIIVEDENSVVIGGLIDESLTKSESRTPCLGDVPVLGWAFKSVDEGEERTNLYVFLTPHVVKSPAEAKALYRDKKEAMDRKMEAGEVSLYKKINRTDRAGKAPKVSP